MNQELAQAFVEVFLAKLELSLAELNREVSNDFKLKCIDVCGELFVADFCVDDEPDGDEIARARWRDEYARTLRNRKAFDAYLSILVDAVSTIIVHLPNTDGPFSCDIAPTEKMLSHFTSFFRVDQNPDFFPKLKRQLHRQLARDENVLDHTPLKQLFPLKTSFGISLDTQFAHTWVCAGSGHGKTTALIAMLYEHLPHVLNGERSIVLIDSQNVIIPELERLKIWEGSDRLIVIDPEDPVAFSLFDVPPHMLNAGIDFINFIFSKLTTTASEMTYRQDNLFNYLSEFLITAVPDATVHDFRAMLNPQQAKDYDKYKQRASDEVRHYLDTDFVKEKFTVDARQQVLTKMRGLFRQPAFVKMFSAPKTKLHLFNELQRGVCILIKPSKYLMGDDGTRLFGRFWIAQMHMVAQQRQNTKKKTPTFFYVDECQDYLRGGDPKLEGMFEQARKENIGVTLLHHWGGQLKSDELVQLLGACTTTKICGSPATSDLTRFATYMQCDPSFILEQQPKKTFAAHVRGNTPRAISLSFPFIDLKNEPKMSEAAYQAMRAESRRRYGATDIAPPERAEPPPPMPGPQPTTAEVPHVKKATNPPTTPLPIRTQQHRAEPADLPDETEY